MSLTGTTNEQKIWNYLKGKGLNNYGIAGLMGNLYAESALEPKNLQNSYEKKLGFTNETYTTAVDSGKYTNFVKDKAGYGLAQWTYWSRKQNMLNFAKSKGKSIGDLEMQLDFLYKELSEGYKSVLNVLKKATSVKQASNAVLLNYERPANQGVSVQNKRAEYGQTYYDKFAQTVQTSTTTDKGGTAMTEMELREKVVSIAKKYYGCKESDGSHRKIIDGYNAVKPLARGYAVKYTDAWCATFVSFVGIEAGLTDIMFRECGCGAMIQLYQNAGRWIENDGYVPQIADIIMYDWDDKGSGECTGYPEHVGIVVSINGNTMKVIEGNISNQVGYRDIAVNARYIRGYCVPNYASKATKATTTTKPTTSTTTQPSTSTSTALNRTVKWNGYVTADELNVRTWAGTENKTCSFSPLKEGVEVGVCDSVKDSKGTIWYYIKYANKYGFVSSKYIQKKDIVANTTPASSAGKVDYAQSYLKSLAGTYKTTANLNLRTGAGTSKKSLCVIPKGDEVKCYGYYSTFNGTKWYFVAYKTFTGFASSKYLKK